MWASDDLGKSWEWLEPTLLNETCDGYSGMVSNGQRVVIADKSGANVFVSEDAGDSWSGPFATGLDRATLNLVGDEFWLISNKAARASSDGGNSWQEVYTFQPETKIVHGAQGLRNITFGYVTSEPLSHGNE